MSDPLHYKRVPDFHVPNKVATLAMWIFLAGLSMLFLAAMLAYFAIRFDLTRFGVEQIEGAPKVPPITPVHLSPLFFVSTFVVLLGSFTIQQSVWQIRREKQSETRIWLWITFAIALLFCLLQIPGLTDLWHQQVSRMQPGANVAQIIACLIILHALHVVGGVIYVAVVAQRAHNHLYDHEHYIGIANAALYWHFLDIIWLLMFTTMYLLG